MIHAKLNLFLITHIISIVIIFESIFMFLATLVSFIYKEPIIPQFLITFTATFASGFLLNFVTKNQRKVEPNKHESVLIVCLSWFILGLVGTLPFLATGAIPEFVNAFFESISGFTTTGSSILSDIEAMPKSILFWRAETHWIGGMGIIVLVVAIMPFLKIHGVHLFYSESSNVASEKVSARIRDVARNMWLVYIGLTAAEIVFLKLGRMPLFDCICHSFATIATGGFSTQNDSIAGYSPYIQYVVMFFMLLSGINFVLHVFLLRKNFRMVKKNEELRLYMTIIISVGMLITVFLFLNHDLRFEQAFRDSFFQVISIITATGFATADYIQWPMQAILLIAILMLIGASSGSTGGGVKVIRHVILMKQIRYSFREIINPHRINVIHYNGQVLKLGNVSSIISFIAVYYLIVLIGTLILIAMGLDSATSFGAAATSMAGIGPGFGTVGPVSNFFHLPTGAKYLLTILMVVGRLEIYAVLIVFTRAFWRP